MTTTPPAPEPVSNLIENGPPRAARSTSGAGTAQGPAVLVPVLACAVLLVGTLAGGGTHGGVGDLAAQLLGALTLAVLCWQAIRGQLSWRGPGWVRWLPALVLVLPMLQLLPVPLAIWSAGPARSELAAQLAQIGIAPLQVLSLDSAATEYALLSLIPATALFLATLTMRGRAQRMLLFLIVVVAVANVLLGMMQLSQGVDSALRLYRPTNFDQAVGFFANRNHMASLLAMCLPVVLVWTGTALMGKPEEGRRVSPLLVTLGCAIIVVLVVGIALTSSRAGLLLGMAGIVASLPLVMRLKQRRGVKRVLAITVGIAVILAVQLSLVGALQRIKPGSFDEGRLKYTAITVQAATAYLPFGSGFGTFRRAYQPFEAEKNPGRYIINHAHNDYAEWFLEGGLPALGLMLVGLAVWIRAGVRLLRESVAGPEMQVLSRACWVAGTLVLLHSALDYPLRATANMVVFAVLAAIALGASGRRRT